MKRFLVAVATTLSAITLASPASAVEPPQRFGCVHRLRGNAVDAACRNTTPHTLTANLYVDCKPNWHNPHVTKPIGPNSVAFLSTKCGGWSQVNGASAYLS